MTDLRMDCLPGQKSRSQSHDRRRARREVLQGAPVPGYPYVVWDGVRGYENCPPPELFMRAQLRGPMQ